MAKHEKIETIFLAVGNIVSMLVTMFSELELSAEIIQIASGASLIVAGIIAIFFKVKTGKQTTKTATFLICFLSLGLLFQGCNSLVTRDKTPTTIPSCQYDIDGIKLACYCIEEGVHNNEECYCDIYDEGGCHWQN